MTVETSRHHLLHGSSQTFRRSTCQHGAQLFPNLIFATRKRSNDVSRVEGARFPNGDIFISLSIPVRCDQIIAAHFSFRGQLSSSSVLDSMTNKQKIIEICHAKFTSASICQLKTSCRRSVRPMQRVWHVSRLLARLDIPKAVNETCVAFEKIK